MTKINTVYFILVQKKQVSVQAAIYFQYKGPKANEDIFVFGLCVVQSVSLQTLCSVALCSRKNSQKMKDMETTEGSEGGREQRQSTNKTPDVEETFWQRKSTKKI